ncbi:MAG TPA: AAA family ATPase [Opitutaceae bacterium]|nr:AAA family ATPase [Opitutaceae bacterium]
MNSVSASPASDLEPLRQIPELFTRLKAELGKRIVGNDEIIRDLFIAVLAQGHCLMVGVPGLAKTLLVKSLAEASDLTFRRIQFTPDLMPSDITGSEILEETDDRRRSFRFSSGPVFTQLLLADEINRAPAKTQSALLEAMEERRVTTAGVTRELPRPFFVLATQNPIEQEGTYPLPEAQLDRFIFCLRLGYPRAADEIKILQATTGEPPGPLEKVCTAATLVELQQAVRRVHVPASAAEFAVSLVQATRPESPTAAAVVKRCVQWGAGPRAAQSLALAAKVAAALDGRLNCAAEDIAASAKVVLRHRLVLNYRAEADQMNADRLIEELLKSVKL